MISTAGGTLERRYTEQAYLVIGLITANTRQELQFLGQLMFLNVSYFVSCIVRLGSSSAERSASKMILRLYLFVCLF